MMNGRIAVGVISCSGMAQAHMAAVRDNERAVLGAVCDIDREKANEAARKYRVDGVYEDYRELLARPDIDAVIIVTPDQLHREMVEQALGAGKHVLCEKPLALAREDCIAIVEAGKRSNRVLMVGQICRFAPGFMLAKQLVDAGEIGELFFVESEYAHDCEQILAPGCWRADPLRHGVVGGGCHAVDLLRWVAGDPAEVTAYSNHKLLPVIPTDDCTIAILRFPDGVIGKVFVSIGCRRDYTMRSVFYGTRGTIICDNTSTHITLYKADMAQLETALEGRNREEVPVLLPVSLANHNTIGEFNAFAEAILSGGRTSMSAEEGAKTLEVCFSIVESAALGRAVKPDYAAYT